MAFDFSPAMETVINIMGKSMTLKRKTSVINEFGDSSDTYESETIYAGVNDYNDEDEWSKYGVFVPGDKLFFIKSSVTKPSEGDEIIHRGETYEIKKIRSPDSGYISHYECAAKRI